MTTHCVPTRDGGGRTVDEKLVRDMIGHLRRVLGETTRAEALDSVKRIALLGAIFDAPDEALLATAHLRNENLIRATEAYYLLDWFSQGLDAVKPLNFDDLEFDEDGLPIYDGGLKPEDPALYEARGKQHLLDRWRQLGIDTYAAIRERAEGEFDRLAEDGRIEFANRWPGKIGRDTSSKPATVTADANVAALAELIRSVILGPAIESGRRSIAEIWSRLPAGTRHADLLRAAMWLRDQGDLATIEAYHLLGEFCGVRMTLMDGWRDDPFIAAPSRHDEDVVSGKDLDEGLRRRDALTIAYFRQIGLEGPAALYEADSHQFWELGADGRKALEARWAK